MKLRKIMVGTLVLASLVFTCGFAGAQWTSSVPKNLQIQSVGPTYTTGHRYIYNGKLIGINYYVTCKGEKNVWVQVAPMPGALGAVFVQFKEQCPYNNNPID